MHDDTMIVKVEQGIGGNVYVTFCDECGEYDRKYNGTIESITVYNRKLNKAKVIYIDDNGEPVCESVE